MRRVNPQHEHSFSLRNHKPMHRFDWTDGMVMLFIFSMIPVCVLMSEGIKAIGDRYYLQRVVTVVEQPQRRKEQINESFRASIWLLQNAPVHERENDDIRAINRIKEIFNDKELVSMLPTELIISAKNELESSKSLSEQFVNSGLGSRKHINNLELVISMLNQELSKRSQASEQDL